MQKTNDLHIDVFSNESWSGKDLMPTTWYGGLFVCFSLWVVAAVMAFIFLKVLFG